MASTDSGSAWSIADDRDQAARDHATAQAEARSPARFVMVTTPHGPVPGLTWQWRTKDGVRQGLTFHPAYVDSGDGGRWVELQDWIDVTRLTPVAGT